ncbi:MAG: hypothetical protein K6D96_03945 [Acetatifactor sp.]|nr:hypothetical protein [Acetatifactor sp.]
MTKEEAEEYVRECLDSGEATEVIKALEQELCEDCVSRKAVDELSKELVQTTRDKADFLCSFWERLQKLPPVTPQEPCEDAISLEAVIEWLKAKDIIKLSSQEDTARKELKALSSGKLQPCVVKTRPLSDDEIKKFVEEMKKVRVQVKPYEPDLGKIKAEINQEEKWLQRAGYNAYNVHIAFNAIRRTLNESEREEV